MLANFLQIESNDVAVIGMACRVAGGNHSPEQLWQTILDKRDCSSEIPAMRWEAYQQRDRRNAKELSRTTRRGYFLDGLERFDPAFFGISPKEAEQMDPQQRLALEVAWEALEHAGVNPKALSGSDTAVFMGVNSDDYAKLLLEDLPNVEAWMGIGTAYCGVPNRISYHLNLMGPSTAVDAACASSLVAIHHGRQAILAGESKVAIVGGVNALCGPGLTRVLDKAGAVSPEGSCLSFDDNAHGYGRGEGAAVVILKRVGDAIRDEDNIVALLKGTAVAQDGKTNGIMAPNAKAQELVARKALAQARVDPSTVGYVEAHATSTPLGDPTEVSAISAVYGQRPQPVMIGSVKPNVGHLEAGAGAVGFIKAVMALNKATFPPQANLTKLNSKVDWDGSGTRVVEEAVEWPESHGHHRRAAICSYGYGGTVSHAVIEQPSFGIPTDQRNGHSAAGGLVTLVISAPQENRLAGQAAALAAWLSSPAGRNEDLMAVANTLALRRAEHDYRAAFVVDGHDQAVEMLNSFAAGGKNERLSQGTALGSMGKRGAIWVFSGHGAQWRDMGRELVTNPVFLHAILPVDRIFEDEAGFSTIEVLRGADLEDWESDKVQVLTYAMQIGLAAVLRSRGVQPHGIIGHSVGEIAASVAAGCLKPEEGALIVARRARLYAQVKGQGAMFLVNLPFDQVQAELEGRQDIVAAINSSPSSCVVSGDAAAVQTYAEQNLKKRGVKAMKVATDIAFHSPGMLGPLAAPLMKLLEDDIQPRPPVVPLYSTSDPKTPRSEDPRDAEYWVRNMINPVLLTSAVSAAVSDGFRLFLEISSHPIVSHSVSETVMDQGVEEFAVIPTLRRNKPAEACILHSIGTLYTKGADVDFKRQFSRRWSPNVPGTQWKHKPIWRKVETGGCLSASNLKHNVENHTLLGLRNQVAGTSTVLYTTELDNDSKPFPGSHPLHGTEIVPAAVLVNTFYHATAATTLSNVLLRVPVAISAPRDVQVVVVDDTVKITSRLQQGGASGDLDHSWTTHTKSRWSATEHTGPNREINIDVDAAKQRIGAMLPSSFSIDYLDKVGVSAMGFPWAITEHYGNLKEMLARVDVAPDAGAELPWDGSSWAPLLDAATSVGSTIFMDNPKLRMPAQIDKVRFFAAYGTRPPKNGWLYVERAADQAVHVSVCNDDGEVLVQFEHMCFSEIEGTPGTSSSSSVESLVHSLAWVPAPFSHKPLSWDKVVLVSADAATLERYGQQLQSQSLTKKIALLHEARSIERTELSANSAIVYSPSPVPDLGQVPAKAETFIAELLTLVKHVVRSSPANAKVFVTTTAGDSPTALAHAPLHGLARIIASEHPDQWGGLIDNEDPASFPTLAMRYVRDQDVIRIQDGLPRVARLQRLPRSAEAATSRLMPRPEGTYVVTGGLGALGLEVADWLVEKGARRVVLVSRRGLPPRREWHALGDPALAAAAASIWALERAGATVHALALDMAAADAAARLLARLDELGLPPVLGVVHAAGVLEDQLVMATTAGAVARVLAPKVRGALALDAAFPAGGGGLDFLVLFSSCGQLFGFPGQASYAAANAFLDALAARRRRAAAADNSIAVQWTSWRGLGMAAGSDAVAAELAGRGITDVSRDDAFRAWEHLGRFDVDHGVVLRCLALAEDEPVPVPILEDVAVRRGGGGGARVPAARGGGGGDGDGDGVPAGGAELKAWLGHHIRGVIAGVLMLGGADEVDPRAAIADLGVDSVMTVTLRRDLQSALKVKVPPTLTWSHPTTNHLVGWFAEKLEAS
ncbi:Type I Iterative PKS [Neofusicoccum ribis]|uniref:6-methylsalicylic acid synthase n=1 Tax=Neofusicoccum ribis TaxID=45134 RepID=A0ABR3SAA7_9PEZI